ncbi:Hypothetical predicted protein [Olea europaea subsp. europaea]|uniref:Uncharacterized protein n=1 Tax=Olea europaea subsp. europaea TaxID=158383 RepID=A0A8S0S751_OLEEU|nr:Hypothetical predicted protein [Olea europaea subsp. europaea]
MRGSSLITSVEEDVSSGTACRGIASSLFVICIDLYTSIDHCLRFVACGWHGWGYFIGTGVGGSRVASGRSRAGGDSLRGGGTKVVIVGGMVLMDLVLVVVMNKAVVQRYCGGRSDHGSLVDFVTNNWIRDLKIVIVTHNLGGTIGRGDGRGGLVDL